MTSEEIKQFRLSLHSENKPLSQRQFAKLFGISKSAIAAYEKNDRPVPPYVQQSIGFFKQIPAHLTNVLIDKAVNNRE